MPESVFMSVTTKRVQISFDPASQQILERMTEDVTAFRSMADTVRESVKVCRALLRQADDGYTQVVVRNPESGAERTIIIPFLDQYGSGAK